MTEEKDRTVPDMKRVIAGLEYCMGGRQVSCFDCPSREIGQPPPNCLDNCGTLKYALELLKEQDKTIESLTKEKEELLLERIAELQHNINALHAAMQDTMLVNNAIEQRKGGEV